MKKRTYIAPALLAIEFSPESIMTTRSLETSEEEMDGSDFMSKKKDKEKTIWNSTPGEFK